MRKIYTKRIRFASIQQIIRSSTQRFMLQILINEIIQVSEVLSPLRHESVSSQRRALNRTQRHEVMKIFSSSERHKLSAAQTLCLMGLNTFAACLANM